MIGQIHPQDKVLAMDWSTIWSCFPWFLIARPQFLRFWQACTAFMSWDGIRYSLLHRDRFDPVGDTLFVGANELHCKPIFVASGESSGTHILILAMFRRRDDRIHKLKLQNMCKCLNLVYVVYDLSGTPSIHSDGDAPSPLCVNDLSEYPRLSSSRSRRRHGHYYW